MAVSSEALHEKLLDRRIEAIKDALSRARTTWLFSMLLTFVIATTIFNATLEYTGAQITRRAKLVSAVSNGVDKLRDIATQSTGELAFLRRLFQDGTGELGYLKELLPTKDDDYDVRYDKLKALRSAAAIELQAYITRRVTFDTVQIPLLSMGIAASDIGIVGGAALAVVGYWLMAVLRRTSHAFGEFIQRPDGGYTFATSHSGYSPEEYAYSYHAVSQYTVFSVSTKDSPLNYITYASFFIPRALLLFNHLASAVMAASRQIPYFEPSTMSELAITALVAWIWGQALFYELDTVNALQSWKELIDSGQTSSRIH
jgi:hypothetical protein